LDSEYFCKHCFKYRLTCTRNDVFSFRVNFFSKLSAHPHDSWVGIIERMNLNVFQYKLLIIASNQDNHKSLFVITGLQNVVAYCHRLIASYHPCILHLDPGKSMLESSLAVLITNNIRLLLNKLYESHVSSNSNKVFNAFASRSMPLMRPTSKQVLCINLYHYLLLDSFKVYAYEYISVRVAKYDFDDGIGIVHYVHSLIGLAGNTITKKDVDTECEGIFSRDNKPTTEGSDLVKLCHDVLELMIMLYHKYLSICLINGNGIPNIDTFKDDGSKLSDVLSLRSKDNEDDSTWDPEDDECNNIDDNSFEDDNVSNGESQDESECESLYGADRTDHVRTTPQFDTRDVAVLKSTNGFLCPGDLVAY
jgi:hypothetical protein